jgi:hypothetical protein
MHYGAGPLRPPIGSKGEGVDTVFQDILACSRPNPTVGVIAII